jgi:hypothetical protein
VVTPLGPSDVIPVTLACVLEVAPPVPPYVVLAFTKRFTKGSEELETVPHPVGGVSVHIEIIASVGDDVAVSLPSIASRYGGSWFVDAVVEVIECVCAADAVFTRLSPAAAVMKSAVPRRVPEILCVCVSELLAVPAVVDAAPRIYLPLRGLYCVQPDGTVASKIAIAPAGIADGSPAELF